MPNFFSRLTLELVGYIQEFLGYPDQDYIRTLNKESIEDETRRYWGISPPSYLCMKTCANHVLNRIPASVLERVKREMLAPKTSNAHYIACRTIQALAKNETFIVTISEAESNWVVENYLENPGLFRVLLDTQTCIFSCLHTDLF